MISSTEKALKNSWHRALHRHSPLWLSAPQPPAWTAAPPEGPCPASGGDSCSPSQMDHGRSVGTLPVLGPWAHPVPLCHPVPFAGGPGAAGLGFGSSGSPQVLRSPERSLDSQLWMQTYDSLAPAPCTWLWVCPRSPRPVPALGSCWPLNCVGLPHLWPVLKLSGLFTFQCPPSTLGLSPHIVIQPAALLSPLQSCPKSTPVLEPSPLLPRPQAQGP